MGEEELVLLPILGEESGLQERVSESVAGGIRRPRLTREVLSGCADDRRCEGEVKESERHADGAFVSVV